MSPSVEPVLQPTVTHVTANNFVLQQVHTLGDSGIATVKLNEFNIFVSFDFEASEYRTEINSLAIDAITDSNGNRYNDFTNRVDHQNINALLVAYIVGGAK